MSTTNTPNHPAGVPCWIETLQPDPEAAARHYAELFGWTVDDPVLTSDGPYRTFRLGGRIVAGLGQAPPGLPSAVWTTFVAVDDLDATIGVAVDAGGSVLLPPSPAVGDGRRAILTDPSGVAFGLWQAGSVRGVEREHEPGVDDELAPHPGPGRGRAVLRPAVRLAGGPGRGGRGADRLLAARRP